MMAIQVNIHGCAIDYKASILIFHLFLTKHLYFLNKNCVNKHITQLLKFNVLAVKKN